jgi:hypothetical protein
MRIGRSAFSICILSAALTAGTSVSALAASSDCGRGPPAWWNAPRVSYTYSGSSYADARHSHTLSAQRRAPVRYTSQSPRWRDPFGRR